MPDGSVASALVTIELICWAGYWLNRPELGDGLDRLVERGVGENRSAVVRHTVQGDLRLMETPNHTRRPVLVVSRVEVIPARLLAGGVGDRPGPGSRQMLKSSKL